jgi:hypothetical protein
VSDGALRDDSRNGPDRSCPLDETAVDNDGTAFLGLHADADLHRGLDGFAASPPNRQLGLFYAWKHEMPDLQSAFYFSAVTYTTTGYGDLVLPKQWRLVGGVEALTGILMCGLSTGLFFAVFLKVFGLDRGSPP